jgi:mannose-6-phosphate isomerase-like protein (cupin superfamily)
MSKMEKKTDIGAWIGNIEDETTGNGNFRTVLFTGSHTQLTVMSIGVGDEIGWESHGHIDQFIRVEQGRARVDLGPDEQTVSEQHEISEDWALIVPAGTWHNVVNIGDEELKVYSLYSPPEHPQATGHAPTAEAPPAEHAHS